MARRAHFQMRQENNTAESRERRGIMIYPLDVILKEIEGVLAQIGEDQVSDVMASFSRERRVFVDGEGRSGFSAATLSAFSLLFRSDSSRAASSRAARARCSNRAASSRASFSVRGFPGAVPLFASVAVFFAAGLAFIIS